jgi:hypothetical protein
MVIRSVRTLIIVRWRYFALIGAFFVTSTRAQSPQSPSEFGKTDLGRVPPVTFVLVQSRDFRLLYCTHPVLESRITRKVCVVDTIGGGPREVPVEKGDSITSILGKMGKEKTTAQIRLIAMNSIEQTPHPQEPGRNAVLLKREVQPGDIVVIAAQE